jgi:diguanylate cyclase (GGDEF)-like protein
MGAGAAVAGYLCASAGDPPGRAALGGLLQAAAAAVVVTELRRLGVESGRDPLTGLHNRRGVERRLDEAVGARWRRGGPPALILLDVDGFKEVNDRQGHAAGDRVLVAIARGLAAATRRSELLGRWGGDEFALVLKEGGARDAAEAARRLQQAVRVLALSISAGWAVARPGEVSQELFARADAELYRSKGLHQPPAGPAGPTQVREMPALYDCGGAWTAPREGARAHGAAA